MRATIAVLLLLLPSVHLRPSLRESLDRCVTYRSSWHRRHTHVPACRSAPKGCHRRLEHFAALFRSAGKQHGVDPWLLAAMATRETSLNPWAEGAAGERTIMQLSARHRRQLPEYWDARAIERCRKVVGACQEAAVVYAAAIMARLLRSCQTESAALGAYNTGRCGENGYVRRVLRRRRQMLGLK